MPDINPNHFTLLRLAILRNLTCEQTDADTFSVGSHSHPKHKHVVNPVKGSCCCPAFGWCSHLAIAYDRRVEREAEMVTRMDYLEARRLDFGGLHMREGLRTDDRRFMRLAVERVREKYGHLFVTKEREAVTF